MRNSFPPHPVAQRLRREPLPGQSAGQRIGAFRAAFSHLRRDRRIALQESLAAISTSFGLFARAEENAEVSSDRVVRDAKCCHLLRSMAFHLSWTLWGKCPTQMELYVAHWAECEEGRMGARVFSSFEGAEGYLRGLISVNNPRVTETFDIVLGEVVEAEMMFPYIYMVSKLAPNK